jgi:hypothetical protein
MESRASERVAMLVVRAWTQPGAGHSFARITSTMDVSGQARTITLADSVEGIREAVLAWLEALEFPGREHDADRTR